MRPCVDHCPSRSCGVERSAGKNGTAAAHVPLRPRRDARRHPRTAPAVARGLARRMVKARGRDLRQEVEDLTQEVFVALFADDARALRLWDPARGASLANFVGLLAEREVASILRSGRRSPWTEDPTASD